MKQEIEETLEMVKIEQPSRRLNALEIPMHGKKSYAASLLPISRVLLQPSFGTAATQALDLEI